MKKTLFIFVLLFGIKVCSQSSFSSQVKNKELKAQISAQEKISEQILDILNTDNKVEKLH